MRVEGSGRVKETVRVDRREPVEEVGVPRKERDARDERLAQPRGEVRAPSRNSVECVVLSV